MPGHLKGQWNFSVFFCDLYGSCVLLFVYTVIGIYFNLGGRLVLIYLRIWCYQFIKDYYFTISRIIISDLGGRTEDVSILQCMYQSCNHFGRKLSGSVAYSMPLYFQLGGFQEIFIKYPFEIPMNFFRHKNFSI